MRRTAVLGMTLAARLLTAGGGARRPDVVLLTLDTTRADHVGRLVEGRPLTPALAHDGTEPARARSARQRLVKGFHIPYIP